MTTPRIPYPTERAQSRGITKQQWGVLIGTTFANAQDGESILQAWDLAQMRGLDVFGGHVAIVSQSRYDKSSREWVNYETCWLTVKALIFLAHSSGTFAGIDEVKFGPIVEKTYQGSRRGRGGQNESAAVTIRAPEYATAKVYRFVKNERCSFTDTVFFDEAVALSQGLPNSVWGQKPMLMLAKCAKVAALRLGFAECDFAAEEMAGQPEASDIIPMATGDAGSPASTQEDSTSHPPATNDNARGFDPAPSFGEAVEAFHALPHDALRWLDRNLETAAQIGAFDQTIDAMRQTLDQSCHQLGETLLQSLSIMAKDAKFSAMWDYIKGARDHGGDAFLKAKGQFEKQAKAGAISHDVSRAAATVLTFMQAAA